MLKNSLHEFLNTSVFLYAVYKKALTTYLLHNHYRSVKAVCAPKRENEKKERSLNVICSNDKECEKIFGAIELGIYFAKTKCGKAKRGEFNEQNSYLASMTEK